MRLDLHVHTDASDGAWSPADVVRGAAKGGLDVIAIADHDTVAAYAVANEVGRGEQVQVIPAMEVSSTHQTRDVHILGYFVDLESEVLLAHQRRAVRRREDRMAEMLERLAAEGVEVTFEEVEQAAGPGRVAIGRPHLAKALLGKGYVASVPEAFDRLIGDDKPAFVPTHLLTPIEAVEMVLGADGIPVWAHPPGDLIDPLLRPLVGAGLRGLEVYRPRDRRSQVLRYEQICRTSALFVTGGSDWHSPDSGASLGDFYVTGDEVASFLDAGGM